MSILIKGMEIPKSCKDCKVYEPMDNGCWGFFCALAGKCLGEKEDILSDGRDADCPLVPVPEHGRLIDADAFVNKHFTNNYIVNAMTASKNELSTALLNIPLVMNNAPTIIPADKEDDKE